MQIIVNGLLCTYERSGKGKTIVLLHGWGDSSKGLQSVSAALAKQFEVITPDLPGFGGSQAPESPWGLDDYASFVQQFLKKLDISQVYAFVAHSNGGAIVIRGLAANKLTADKLILLASAGIRGAYRGRVKAVRYATKVGKALSTPLPKGVKKSLRQKVYASVGSDMLVAEHLQETFKKVITDDVQSGAAQLTLPVLLIYGEDDEQTPVDYGETFHERMQNSTLVVLPGAGHFIYLDRPHEVVKAIEGFLR